MGFSAVALPDKKELEDPLAYLPCSSIAEYRKNEMIYHRDQPPTSIYLVIGGTVKVTRVTENGKEVLVDILRSDEFFGESAFLNLPRRSEQAIALENSKIMTWTVAEIEGMMMIRPQLAVALLQILVQRGIDFTRRIESFSIDTIARRLARSLIVFSERLGTEEDDGSIRMMPFTHELLSQCVGTSREIVTHYMSQFRRQGYIRYSRKGIILYRDAFREWLRHEAECGPSDIGPARSRAAGPLRDVGSSPSNTAAIGPAYEVDRERSLAWTRTFVMDARAAKCE